MVTHTLDSLQLPFDLLLCGTNNNRYYIDLDAQMAMTYMSQRLPINSQIIHDLLTIGANSISDS
jgi:hypothetical protein